MAVVKKVTAFLKDVGDDPDWITKLERPDGSVALYFVQDARTTKYRHLDSKKMRKWNAAWEKTRKSLAKDGLIASTSAQPYFKTADGKDFEISVGGLSGGPGPGEPIPVP